MSEQQSTSALRRRVAADVSGLRSKVAVISQVVRSKRLLRHVDSVGRWARVTSGNVVISNRGRIEFGSRVRLMCAYGATELRVGHGAVLRIGERTVINYGTDVHVAHSISIGDRVSIGPRCIITDSAFVVSDDPRSARNEPAGDIVIEDDVWLATRVTVTPGSHIGRGSVITAGSIVEGVIPPGVIAGGNPIRVLRHLGASDDAETAPAPVAPRDAHGDTEGADGLAPRVAPQPHGASIDLGGLLISDFTIDPLATALTRMAEPLSVSSEVAPFGTVVPTLMAPASERSDFAVVWTKPDSVLESFKRLVDGDSDVGVDDLCADVDALVAMITQGLANFHTVVVPTWTVPTWQRGRGVVDLKPGGVRWALNIANSRLIEALGDVTNTIVLDAQRWMTAAGAQADSPRLWYLGKIPFSDRVFDAAAGEIGDILQSVHTPARKLVVVDLDNTMWGGVVGDLGWRSIRLGGHDGAGEAFVDFQRSLRTLKRRGVALAIVSKNEEHIAMEAIERHDEMVLRADDFVGWRINWSDKALNIVELAEELNLGLQSVVFIDDNPHERTRVSEALPEVLVPDWPEDPSDYVSALSSMSCFDTISTTAEDRTRTELYATEGRRQDLRSTVGSLDDWIRDLGIVVRAEPLDDTNLERTAQLLNKTNQMNLTTRRLSEQELADWARGAGRETWCVRVSDRLGEAGLTGIVSVERDGQTARLIDFVLSCRVMGRRVEESLVYVAGRIAESLSTDALVATILPTAKNNPCRRFFDGSAFDVVSDDEYRSDLDALGPPDDIDIVIDGLDPSGRP